MGIEMRLCQPDKVTTDPFSSSRTWSRLEEEIAAHRYSSTLIIIPGYLTPF